MREIKINRIWAMPNKWTFRIKPIAELIKKYILKNNNWIDPFAGMYSPAKYRNDLNPECNADFNEDARDFLKRFSDNEVDGVLFDPPYSVRQVVECYKGIGKVATHEETKMTFYSICKNEMARIIKINGYAICFGWTSMGLGKNRGFKMIEILLVPHGGTKNDTICTVEKKIINMNQEMKF